MQLEPTSLSHPTRRQLVAFAEQLVDRGAPVSVLTASHVAGCPRCAAEVKRIRASLELAALAPAPEPSRDLMPRIVARARAARRNQQTVYSESAPSRFLRSAACVAGIIALAWFSFGMALNGRPALTMSAAELSSGDDDTVAASPGALQQQTAVVKALSTALSRHQEFQVSPFEEGHRRALEVLDRDVSAALAALERNPGCVRANQVMHMSLERQLEGLRNLYLDRTL